MTRRLVIALLAVCMSAHFTACSSSGSKDDTSVAELNDETFAEEGEGDFAEVPGREGSKTHPLISIEGRSVPKQQHTWEEDSTA